SLGKDAAILYAIAGMVPPGKSDIEPAVNTHQTLVAVKKNNDWQVELFQNTPAQFHRRPELVEEMTEELRQLLYYQWRVVRLVSWKSKGVLGAVFLCGVVRFAHPAQDRVNELEEQISVQYKYANPLLRDTVKALLEYDFYEPLTVENEEDF